MPRDADEALRWYRMAAEQDYAPAQATLGDLYLNGEAVPQEDDAEAARWYRRAAEQGHARSPSTSTPATRATGP